MRKRIMVTGAAGFIGGNLCRRLVDEGYAVVGIDDLSTGIPENVPADIDFHLADIRGRAIHPLFKDIDTVFHLAAKNCLFDCLNSPLETSDINVRGTVNVLEASKEAGIGKFVYADSSAVYEGVRDFPSKVERVKPVGAYAISKHSGALFAEMYRAFHGLNLTTLRYFNVYGPAQDYRRIMPPAISAFILKIFEGNSPIIYGDGTKRRDFVYVDDVNDLHLLTIEDPRTDGRVFNVGSGANYSVIEIFNLISEAMHVSVEPILLDELPGEAEVTLADITQTLELGWRPRTNIRRGILNSIEYLKKEFESGKLASLD